MPYSLDLHLIEKLFFSVVNNKSMIEKCLESEVFAPMCVDMQDNILDVTIRNSLCENYAPPKSFQKCFLRCLLNVVERFGSECSDGLVKAYIDTLSMQPTETGGYHSYKIHENCTITLQENSCFVANSTTGLQTWEASKYLSEWCIRNASNLDNKTILELGSGIGLLGIAVLKLCSPRKYMFSDKSWEVLRVLSKNISINIEEPENLLIEQHQLVWTNVNDEDSKKLLPNIILGADLVYDTDMIDSLVHALKTFLVSRSSCAYIANTIRNPETNEKFLRQLGTSGLTYEVLETHQKSMFIYNKSSSFMLYKIFIIS